MSEHAAGEASPIRDAIAKRLPRRYAAERRFRAMGVAGVAVGVLALAILFYSIVTQGYSAFYTHYLTLDVPLEETRIDPRGERDPEALRRGNFNGILQDALRAEYPNVTARRDVFDLFGLTTIRVNGVLLMRKVLDDPGLVGETVRFRMLVSDDIDLYLKGRSTPVESTPGRGIASPSGVVGDIEISSTSNDFAELLSDLKTRLESEAARLELEAERFDASAARADDPAVAFQRRQQAERLRERAADYAARARAPGASEELTTETPSALLFINGGVVRLTEISNIVARGEVVAPLRDAADAPADAWRIMKLITPEADRQVSDRQIAWSEDLRERGLITTGFNTALFGNADSREPEHAGVLGAFVGSLLTMLVTMFLAVPIGVGAAVYLEEFAPKNRLIDIVEVNINNLAAVPSIVFGLLGLAVFLNFFGMPRSAPLVGGLVLALMTFPTVIIATRAALKAVPPSIRTGALGVGASQVQTVFHHVLPLALPGIMTGSIIGLAQALGETAPLLMIGMVAFVADVPSGLTSPATAMPVQIYIWSDSAERAFESRTAAAIVLLLGMLVVLNLAAVMVRRRFERRW